MPLQRALERVVSRTRAAPRLVRFASAVGITTACLVLRILADPIMPPGYPFLLGFLAVLLTAALFDLYSGLLSVALVGVAAALFFFPPYYSLRIENVRHAFTLSLFVGIASTCCLIMETLHGAMARLKEAHVVQASTERRRSLLFLEYRHRARNDLANIGALLHLRAKLIPDLACQRALKEGAEHTRDLAKVHTHLEHSVHDFEDVAWIGTESFIRGLCSDLTPPINQVKVEDHQLSNERAVQLGMLMCEMIRDVRRDGSSKVQIRFCADGDRFVLQVVNQQSSDVSGDSLRTKMCGLLARQLRGDYRRELDGSGIIATVTFARTAPNLAAARVGT